MPTSRLSRPRSCPLIPLSIASCTTTSALTGAAAEQIPTSARTATRMRRPTRYRPSRVRPVRRFRLRSSTDFLAEEGREEAAGAQQLVGGSGLDHDAVVEHDRAVGDLDGREALGRKQDGPAGERGAEVLDEVALGL